MLLASVGGFVYTLAEGIKWGWALVPLVFISLAAKAIILVDDGYSGGSWYSKSVDDTNKVRKLNG